MEVCKLSIIIPVYNAQNHIKKERLMIINECSRGHAMK